MDEAREIADLLLDYGRAYKDEFEGYGSTLHVENVIMEKVRKIIQERDKLKAKVEQAVCDECGGFGEVDSGGFTPWMAPINVPCGKCSKPEPQPQKTRVRLWKNAYGSVMSNPDCENIEGWREIRVDSEGFYVEERS